MSIKKKVGRRTLRSNAKPYNNKKGGWEGKGAHENGSQSEHTLHILGKSR